MPYLALGQANRIEILGLFPTTDRGFLYDPVQVEYRILNSSGAVVVNWTDVTSSGRRGVGAFYAPFTPSSPTFTVARNYVIEWRFSDSTDPTTDRTWSLPFDIYTAGTAIPFRTYLTPGRVRDEGVGGDRLADARLVQLIQRAQQFIERECRQPFRPVQSTVRFDGSGSGLWQAPLPILGVEYLRVNDATSNYPSDAFEVYSSPHLGGDPGWQPKDNRRNPKIRLARDLNPSPFRANPSGSLTQRFLPGAKAHVVKGVWGFVEPDGTTPLLIEEAALRVVLATATLMEIGAGAGGVVAGPIIREETDLHEIEYASSASSASSADAIATSPEVSDILRRYRAPMALGSPATSWSSLVP